MKRVLFLGLGLFVTPGFVSAQVELEFPRGQTFGSAPAPPH